MTREEIKEQLYSIADRFKENADKYTNGTLKRADWIEVAKSFNSIINYLANPWYEPNEIVKIKEE